jgi:hypothetical protein
MGRVLDRHALLDAYAEQLGRTKVRLGGRFGLGDVLGRDDHADRAVRRFNATSTVSRNESPERCPQ